MERKKNQKAFACFRPPMTGLKRYFALSLGMTFGGILFGFLTPQVIRFTVDSVIGEEPFELPEIFMTLLNNIGGREALRSNLLLCAAAIFLCTLLEGAFGISSRLLISHGTETYMKRLRDSVFGHIQHLPFSWHTANRTGDTIQRCTADMDVIRNFIANQMLELIRIVILAVTAVILMASMNVTLTVIAVIFIPVIASYSGVFFSKLAKRFRAADEAESDLLAIIQENLTGVRVVRAFGRERFEAEKMRKQNSLVYNMWVDMGYILGAYWGVGDLVTGIQVMTILGVGAYMAAAGTITLGEFFVFVAYNRTLAFPLKRLGRILSDLSKTKVAAERLEEIFNAPEEQDVCHVVSPPVKGDIAFHNVTFAYENTDILKNVSFDIEAGSTFGILGNTGSGKSTVSYLIDRLYDLKEGCGSITLDGRDIRQIDLHYLRSKVGLVLQEPFLFSKTVAENIAVSKPDADIKEIRHAASIADVDESIMGFSQGYDTLVGERGVTLSGGQKQRVAIARTLMKNCPIMIFDDSLSAVDLETDARIRKALKAETGKATVILISHRINTLMDCDRILVLENGEAAEIGTHEELLAKNGIYRRTYDLQSAASGEEDKK